MAKSKKFNGVYTVEGKKGTSYGIDYIHPQTNQRVRKILKNVSSMEKAAEIRAIEIADAKRGVLNTVYNIKENKTKPVLFEDMVKAYLQWYRDNPDKKAWETCVHKAKPLLKAFRGKLMSDINSWMVEKYKNARAKERARSTVNSELTIGSETFAWAIRSEKYSGENPFSKVPRVKIKIQKTKALSPEQVEAIKDEIKHPIRRDMVAFAFYQGWRISEIRNLKWEDVDLEAGTAWVADPKNGEPVELVLSDMALEIISMQEKRSEYVFCKMNGKPYLHNLWDCIGNAAKRAGVVLPPRKKWHIFRHTWASLMLQNGTDVETLRKMVNWKTAQMPLRYASALNKGKRREKLNQMPKLNGRKMPEIQNMVDISERVN